MKIFFIVLIGSVISFAQIPNAYLCPDNSSHYILYKSLTNFDPKSQSPTTFLNFINNNIYHVKDTTRQKMDSIMANSITGNKLKLLFEYDYNSNIIEVLSLGWSSSTGWVNNFKNEYYYDNENNLILHLNLGWNGTEWDSSFKFNYFYNNQNKITQYIFQVYYSGIWENYQRVSFAYDIYGNEIERTLEEWQNKWVNKFLYTNYYSNITRRDSLLIKVLRYSNWEDTSKTLFYYNQQTQYLESFITKIWTGENWENSIKRMITNDQHGNQIFQLDQFWNGNNWENLIRRFYTYAADNYTLSAYCELWNGSQWYLDDGFILIENPDGFNRLFESNNISIFYKATGIFGEWNQIPNDFVLYQNFPNPFNSSTTIKYVIPKSSRVILKVFDMLGSEVATVVDKYQVTGSYEVTWDASSVSRQISSGIYFYKFEASNYRESKKLILLK